MALGIGPHKRHMPRMNRRTLLRLAVVPVLLAPAAAFAQASFSPTPRDAADLLQVQTYLNSIHTLRAHFLQVAPDGAMS